MSAILDKEKNVPIYFFVNKYIKVKQHLKVMMDGQTDNEKSKRKWKILFYNSRYLL